MRSYREAGEPWSAELAAAATALVHELAVRRGFDGLDPIEQWLTVALGSGNYGGLAFDIMLSAGDERDRAISEAESFVRSTGGLGANAKFSTAVRGEDLARLMNLTPDRKRRLFDGRDVQIPTLPSPNPRPRLSPEVRQRIAELESELGVRRPELRRWHQAGKLEENAAKRRAKLFPADVLVRAGLPEWQPAKSTAKLLKRIDARQRRGGSSFEAQCRTVVMDALAAQINAKAGTWGLIRTSRSSVQRLVQKGLVNLDRLVELHGYMFPSVGKLTKPERETDQSSPQRNDHSFPFPTAVMKVARSHEDFPAWRFEFDRVCKDIQRHSGRSLSPEARAALCAFYGVSAKTVSNWISRPGPYLRWKIEHMLAAQIEEASQRPVETSTTD